MRLLTIDMALRKRQLKDKIVESKALTRRVIARVEDAERAFYRAKGVATKAALARYSIMDAALGFEGSAPSYDPYAPWKSGHIGSFRNAKRNKGDILNAKSKRMPKGSMRRRAMKLGLL